MNTHPDRLGPKELVIVPEGGTIIERSGCGRLPGDGGKSWKTGM